MSEEVVTTAYAEVEVTVGLLGVTVPPEWGYALEPAQQNFMRDMRLNEIERRILALEANNA